MVCAHACPPTERGFHSPHAPRYISCRRPLRSSLSISLSLHVLFIYSSFTIIYPSLEHSYPHYNKRNKRVTNMPFMNQETTTTTTTPRRRGGARTTTTYGVWILLLLVLVVVVFLSLESNPLLLLLHSRFTVKGEIEEQGQQQEEEATTQRQQGLTTTTTSRRNHHDGATKDTTSTVSSTTTTTTTASSSPYGIRQISILGERNSGTRWTWEYVCTVNCLFYFCGWIRRSHTHTLLLFYSITLSYSILLLLLLYDKVTLVHVSIIPSRS